MFVNETLKTEIIDNCDVLVCGGGFAGISAREQNSFGVRSSLTKKAANSGSRLLVIIPLQGHFERCSLKSSSLVFCPT